MNRHINRWMLRLNRALERLLSAGLPAYPAFRLAAGLNLAPIARVRGVPIRCLLPLDEAGVYLAFREWEAREPETLDWLDRLRPSDELLDIGTSIGQETLYAGRKPGGPQRIISVEADLYTGFLLANNLAINQLSQVELHITVLAGRPGDMRFPAQATCYSLPGMERRYPVSYWMSGRTADELCAAHGYQPTHVKMDVDGAELNLLGGMQQLLAAPTTRSWLIEVNADTRPGVTEMLAQHGFVPCQAVSHGATVNVIFERPGSSD